MPGTRVEGIFEELKKFFSPGSIWQKALVPQHNLLESYGTPNTKLNIAQKVFAPFYDFAIVSVPLILNKKQKFQRV